MWNFLLVFSLSLLPFVLPSGCDHPQLTHTLHALAQNYSSNAILHSIGRSVNGQELWVLTLGASVSLRPLLRPQVKLVGNINGFSGPACETLLTLAKELLEGGQLPSSPEASILSSLELQILFDMNPDGYEASTKGSCTDRRGRGNGEGVDLNRDFPRAFPEEEDETRVFQPETEAVVRWTLQNNFVLSLSFVSGHTLATIPFDDKLSDFEERHLSPDHDMFVHLASHYAEDVNWSLRWNCPLLNRSFSEGWVNGAEWYPVRGTMMDFNYVRAGTPEMTFGLSCCRNENGIGALRDIWRRHKKGIYFLLDAAGDAFRGQIVDEESGDVIEGAMLTRVADPTSILPPVPWFSSQQGEFWRLLPPGEHQIMVEKEGYFSERVLIKISIGEKPLSRTILLRSTATKPSPTTTVLATTTGQDEKEETTTLANEQETTTERAKEGGGVFWSHFHTGFQAMKGALTSSVPKLIAQLLPLTITLAFNAIFVQ